MGDLVQSKVFKTKMDAESFFRKNPIITFRTWALSRDDAFRLFGFYSGREGYKADVKKLNYIGTGKEIFEFTLRRIDVGSSKCNCDHPLGDFIHLR